MNRQPRILYIDDESDFLQLVASFFEDESIKIETCANFSEALNKIRSTEYDVIISDAGMPIGGGKELLAIIREENVFKGKFVLVTGNLDYQDPKEKDPFDLVMIKPIKLVELVERVKGMLPT